MRLGAVYPQAEFGRVDPDEIIVHEEGVPFSVRLGDGLSTGIFLDQRPNRRLVRESSRGATG